MKTKISQTYYPFKYYGVNSDSIELHNEYFGCIGWKPTENIWVKWFDVFFLRYNYVQQNEVNELEKTAKNDLRISQAWKKLVEVKRHPLTSELSRLKIGVLYSNP